MTNERVTTIGGLNYQIEQKIRKSNKSEANGIFKKVRRINRACVFVVLTGIASVGFFWWLSGNNWLILLGVLICVPAYFVYAVTGYYLAIAKSAYEKKFLRKGDVKL